VIVQGFALGGVQIAVSMTVNATIVLLAGTIAGFLAARPTWLKLQRWLTGTLLGAVGLRLAIDAPNAARA
jgi:threonine/homoserine/homoserine lactone efflux protein